MNSIAVLDDRQEQRQTVMRSINLALPNNWSCIECPLLDDYEGYADWLTLNDVCVLLADQVLNEQDAGGDLVVDYKGHQVIESIRKTFPNFPIFLISAYTDDEDLQDHLADAEDVLTRNN